MKKVFISAVVLSLLIFITSIGFASFPRTDPHTEASGTFITTSTTINSEMDDKFNTVIDLRSVITYTGTLEGTSTLEGTLAMHRDESASFQGVETFIGLVNGVPGTLIFELAGNSDIYQAIQITGTITNATGQLAKLHGILSKTGIIKDDGPVGTYTVQISNE